MRDHSLQKDSYSLIDNSLLFFKNTKSVFVRENPKPKLTKKEIQKKINEFEGFYFKKLSSKTILLRISSFNYPYVERIENLIEENISLLESCENLIIDLRNNLGGTDNAYQKLLPYIYTNPVRIMNAEYLATPSLIKGLQNWIQKLPDEDKYLEEKEEIKKEIEFYKANLGKFVDIDSIKVYFDTVKIILQSPKRIAILANKNTASSAEFFIFITKQSKKVKLLGIPTAGVLDYGSVREFDFECEGYNLYLPTYRTLRIPDYPLDNIGIQPDIYMDKYVEDWVKYAKEYLEN